MNRARSLRGFTLVELIVVLIVVGILAVIAIPRFTGVGAYNNMGYTDRVMESLRYAQKQAIAKRRNVCVVFDAATTTVTFRFASAAGSAINCDTNLTGPAGQTVFSVTPESKSVVTFSASPGSFAFDALGRPIASTSAGVVGTALSVVQVITITGEGSRSFSVEPETGYVHT
jgi:MSHA pilin protein MshC